MRGALVFLLCLQYSHTKEKVKVQKWQGSEDAPNNGLESFLDALTEDVNPLTSVFGFETLQALHAQHLQCNMNLSSAELKYSKQLTTLSEYHRSMEKLVSVPKFANISNVDRPTLETNYHRTLRHLERTRNGALRRIKMECDTQQREWLTMKFETAVNRAKEVIRNSPKQYRRMIAEVKSSRAKMEEHLASCRSRDAFELLYCYVDELEVMLEEIEKYLTAMQHLVLVYMHLGDDEDLAVTGGKGSGNGNEFETTPPVPDPVFETTPPVSDPVFETTPPVPDSVPTTNMEAKQADKTYALELPGRFFVNDETRVLRLPDGFLGRVPDTITRSPPKESDQTSTATPTDEQEITSTASKPSPAIKQDISSDVSNDVSTPESLVSTNNDKPSFITSEVPSTRGKTVHTTAGALPWVERAFEEVTNIRERRPGKDPGSRAKASKPHSPSQGAGEVEVEGRLDGGGLAISVELDLGNQQHSESPGPVLEGIVLDPVAPPPDHEEEEEKAKQGWRRPHYYILGFFVLTVGVVISTIVIVAVVAVSARRARRRRDIRDPPLISEKEMLDVMKKTGYVNPTYKFYTQS